MAERPRRPSGCASRQSFVVASWRKDAVSRESVAKTAHRLQIPSAGSKHVTSLTRSATFYRPCRGSVMRYRFPSLTFYSATFWNGLFSRLLIIFAELGLMDHAAPPSGSTSQSNEFSKGVVFREQCPVAGT